MGRRAKPPRLWFREDRDEYIILDRGRQIRMGCPRSDPEGDSIALQRYLTTKHAPDDATLPFDTVGEVLAYYLSEKRDTAIAFDRLCFAAKTLGPFFADLAPEEVTRARSRAYTEKRRHKVSSQTVRKELSVLDSALRFPDSAGRIRGAFNVVLPKKAGPRDVYLTQEELRGSVRQAGVISQMA